MEIAMRQDDERSMRIGIAIGRFVVGAGIGAVVVVSIWSVAIWIEPRLGVQWLVWPLLGASLACGLLGLVVGDRFIDAGRVFMERLFGSERWW